MSDPNRFARSQRVTMVNAALVFAIVLVVLQLWLLTATMNAYLAGDDGIAVPAAIVSIVCLTVNLGFLRYLYRLG